LIMGHPCDRARPFAVDVDDAFGVEGVGVETGPGIVFGFGGETAGYGIAVEIAEFFDALVAGEQRTR
jgi:hypothetical protein